MPARASKKPKYTARLAPTRISAVAVHAEHDEHQLEPGDPSCDPRRPPACDRPAEKYLRSEDQCDHCYDRRIAGHVCLRPLSPADSRAALSERLEREQKRERDLRQL